MNISNLDLDDVVTPAPASTPEPTFAPEPVVSHTASFAYPRPNNILTADGKEMSPRMSRCYGWFQANGCRLTPFSTDGQVSGLAASIERAIDKAIATIPAHNQYKADLLVDLRAVASRSTANRIAATNVEAPIEPSIVEQIVTTDAASASTGAVAFWCLSGVVDLTKFNEAWETAADALVNIKAPTTPSFEIALRRACQDQASRSLLCRKHPKGGFALVAERVEAATLVYNADSRVALVDDAVQCEGLDAQLVTDIENSFKRYTTSFDSTDVSAWLVDTMRTLKAVPLRDRGGLYFVPRTSMAVFKAIKEVLNASSAHVVYEIPAMKSAETMAAILDAVRKETEALASEIEGELNAGVWQQARAVVRRLAMLAEARDKVESYERLLSTKMPAMLARLADLSKKLSSYTTSTAQLDTTD